jgi:succinate dehydrogenase hydrophobic anchor subunit
MGKILLILTGILTVLATGVIMAFLLGWLVAILWNASLVILFHFPELDWWMGTKLVWLSYLLFHSSSSSD